MPIEREKIISDDALKVPLTLAGNFDKLFESISQVLELVKKFDTSSSGGGLPKLKTDTEELTLAQAELIKIQNQIAVQNARNNDSYRESQQVLSELKDEMKATAANQDLKKNFDAQYASLTEMEKALKSNQIAWASLRGEEQRKSAQGLQLKETIAKQFEATQKLRDEIKLTTQEHKGWKEEAEKVMPVLKKLAPEAVETGEALKGIWGKVVSVATSPLGIGLAAVAAGIGLVKHSMDLYTESTVSGADKAEQWSLAWSTATEMINSRFKKLGETIVENISDEGIMATVIQGVLSQLPGGIALMAEYNARLAANTEILKIQQDLRKEEVVLGVEVAEIELEKEEKMYEARDKVTKDIAHRYEALKEANALIEEEVALKKQSADKEFEIIQRTLAKKKVFVDSHTEVKSLFEDENILHKVGYELIEKLADAQKKLISVEAERYAGARRRQALLASLLDDEVNMELAKEEQIIRARRLGYENQAQEDINAARKIIGNQQYSFDAQKAAQEEFTAASIRLDEGKLAQELDGLKKSSLQRIQLDQNTLNEIKENNSGSIEEMAKAYREAKEKQLESDKAYNAERNQILSAHIEAQKEIVIKGTNDVGKIYQTYNKNLITEQETQNLSFQKGLEDQYAKGEITFKEYDGLRRTNELGYKVFELELQRDLIKDELKYYDSKKTLTAEEEQRLIDLKKQYAQLDLAIERDTNAEKLRMDQAYRQATINLRQETFTAIGNIVNASLDSQIQSLQNNLSKTQAAEQAAVAEAGNNARAKNNITKRYVAAEAAAQKEIAQKQTQKAIFDKVLTATDIVLKTSQAVMEAVATFPYTAGQPLAGILEAIGAVELAAVVATPIPHYATGTMNAKKGLSVVNDGTGKELIQDGPSGKYYMYDVPGSVLTYLNEGSKVFTAEQTKAMSLPSSTIKSFPNYVMSSTVVDLSPMNKRFDELNKTIKNKKMGVTVVIKTQSDFEKMAQYRYK